MNPYLTYQSLAPLCIAAVSIAGAALILRSYWRRQKENRGEAIVYGPYLRRLGLIAAVLGPLVLVLAVVVQPPVLWEQSLLLCGINLLLGLLGNYFLLEATRFSITVGSQSLIRRSTWSKPWEIPWSEVEQISYNPISMVFIIKTRGGKQLKVSQLLVNIQKLAQAAKKRLEPAQYEHAMGGFEKVEVRK